MKKLSVLLLVIIVSLNSPGLSQEKETEEGGSFSFQPKPLVDDWNKWLVGEWEGQAKSHAGNAKFSIKIDFGLNGQFLIMETDSKLTELTDEQKQYLKNVLHASDEDIDEYCIHIFRDLKIYTIDPYTGDVVAYLFDSMRCISEGRGKRQGNKEIIEWVWSGNAKGATSVTTIEKINDDKFTLNHKYILPNGNEMEDKTEITRVKTVEKES
jgi:hypothetical protein